MTAPLARQIAGSDHSIYCFEGCKKGGGNRCLHITSTRFDEPIAEEAVKSHEFIVAIHGAAEDDREWVMIGGLAGDLAAAIAESLSTAGFGIEPCDSGRGAQDPSNLCNRSQSHGVQLELSARLRDRLKVDIGRRNKFVDAVRAVLPLERTSSA